MAEVFVREFFGRYGVPRQLHSDQGSQFESKLFQEMCQLLGIDKTRTTSYRPQSDGQVERFNRTMEAMLSAYVASHQRDWDEHLPLVAMAYRASIHESTGETPNLLWFGREVDLPIDLVMGLPPVSSLGVSEYVYRLKQRMDRAHEVARAQLNKSAKHQKKYYDPRSNSQKLAPGDALMLIVGSKKVGVCPKLQARWEGPYIVLATISDVVIRIQ